MEKNTNPETNSTLDISIKGLPTFPIGIYNHCTDIITDQSSRELDLIRDAGFNVLSQYNLPTTDKVLVTSFRSFMDKCLERGISILANATAPLSLVDAYHSHPTLFAYSIGEDVNDGRLLPDETRHLNLKFKDWDINHYTFIPFLPKYNTIIDPADYLGSCDIIGIELYPIDNPAAKVSENPVDPFTKENELLRNEKDCAEFQMANQQDTPWFALTQVFSWANYPEGNPQGQNSAAYPTPDELRNIVYIGLINGAKGIFYYEWHNPGEVRGEKVYHKEFKLYSNEPLWSEVKLLNSELKTLQDVYMFGQRTKLQGNTDWLSASYWLYEGSTYIIVANLHRTETQTFSYAINAAGKLSIVFKYRKGTLSYAEGKISGRIPARQVQVYKIKLINI
jgi:hypothetical protein